MFLQTAIIFATQESELMNELQHTCLKTITGFILQLVVVFIVIIKG